MVVRSGPRTEWQHLGGGGPGLTARCFCHEIDHLSGHLFDELVDRTYTIEELEAMEAEGKEVEE